MAFDMSWLEGLLREHGSGGSNSNPKLGEFVEGLREIVSQALAVPASAGGKEEDMGDASAGAAAAAAAGAT